MKRIEDLEISPTPWTNKLGSGTEWNSVWDALNGEVLSGGYIKSTNDARLIAAAPKLYDAVQRYISADDEMDGVVVSEELIERRKTAYRDMRSALAEAAGDCDKKGETK